jgi:hypothetical protein
MKNMLQKILFAGLLLIAVSSCKKEETKIFFEGGVAPVLSPGSATLPPLSIANKANEALTLSWTNPNYRFTTGVNSQDVSYILQIDKA